MCQANRNAATTGGQPTSCASASRVWEALTERDSRALRLTQRGSHCARATVLHRHHPASTCASARLTVRRRARALENSTSELAPPYALSLLTYALHSQLPSRQPLRKKMAVPVSRGLSCICRALGWWSRQVGRDGAEFRDWRRRTE
jgi:hypothetical protein